MTAAPSRRGLLGVAAGAAAALLAAPALAQGAARIVVIGGGFAGASAARALRRANPSLAVTLVESSRIFTACPFSNEVIAGLRPIEAQRFGYDALAAEGIALAFGTATGIDTQARQVTLETGDRLPYDRLVLAPGIDIRWDGLPGYDETAAEAMPHAWKAGAQTLLLRAQLEAMADGGTVVMSAPENPFRCPPGPYERASLVAHYLKTRKPRSKLILLDAKDTFSKQRLFQAGWRALYGERLEWVGLSAGGKVTAIESQDKVFVTEFGRHRADVGNVIPPQKAGRIAALAGVADRTGWCPVDPVSFESKLVAGIHVVGDAAVGGAMPKSAFAARAQAEACARAIMLTLRGESVPVPRLINTCYSLLAPDYGISIAGVYAPANGLLADVPGAGGVSPLDAPAAIRNAEAGYARGWFATITRDVFG